jgi:hypothetical protein
MDILSLPCKFVCIYILNAHLMLQHVIVEVEMGSKRVTRHKQSTYRYIHVLVKCKYLFHALYVLSIVCVITCPHGKI